MARIAEYRDDISGSLTTGGTLTAYTLTTNQGLATPTPTTGQLIALTPHVTNGASATLSCDGGSAYPFQTSPGTAIGASVLAINQPYSFKFTGTAWIPFNQVPLGVGNVSGPLSSTAGHIATFADATGKLLQDGGVPVGAANSITPLMYANAAVGFALGMLNGTFTVAAAGSLTITLKTLAGATPSASDPVFFLIRDASAGFVVIEQTAALSIVIPATATIGTVSAQASRLWVGVFNNSGTAVLGVYNSLNAFNVIGWDETSNATGTGISTGSGNAQTWYTASGVTGAFRVIGYIDSTQATAGSWITAPSKIQLFGPGLKKPGDIIQTIYVTNATADTAATTSFTALTHNVIAITPQSSANLIYVKIEAPQFVSTSNLAQFTLSRGTVNNTNLFGGRQVSNTQGNVALFGFSLPNTTSSTTYCLQGLMQTSGSVDAPGNGGVTALMAQEIQI